MVVMGLWLSNLRRGCTLTIYHTFGRLSSAKVLRVLGYHGFNALSRIKVLRVWVDANVLVWSRIKVLRVDGVFWGMVLRVWVCGERVKKVEESC